MAGLLEQLALSGSLVGIGSFPLREFPVNTRGRNLTGTVPLAWPCLRCGVGLLGDVTSFDCQSCDIFSRVPCDCGSHPAPCLANQECFWGQSKYLPRGRDSVRSHNSSWKWPFGEGSCSGESSCSENVSYFSVEIKAMTFTLSSQVVDGSDASLTLTSSMQFNKLLLS